MLIWVDPELKAATGTETIQPRRRLQTFRRASPAHILDQTRQFNQLTSPHSISGLYYDSLGSSLFLLSIYGYKLNSDSPPAGWGAHSTRCLPTDLQPFPRETPFERFGGWPSLDQLWEAAVRLLLSRMMSIGGSVSRNALSRIRGHSNPQPPDMMRHPQLGGSLV